MKILVPVDFGKEAENAKEFASAIAKITNGSILFLHTTPPMYNFASLEEETGMSLVRHAKDLMGKYVKELDTRGVKGSYRTMEDNLWSAIESIVVPYDIDVIIMGTKGAKGIKKFLVGSNAGEIFKSVNVPIVLIPLGASYAKLKKIVITIEDTQIAPDYIGKVLELTKKWGLCYEILHFNSPDSDEVDEVREQHINILEELYPGTSFGLSSRFSSTVQEGLKQYQTEHPEAMLVMLSSHKSELERYFSKSDTEQMIYRPVLPLLVIKEDSIN